MTKHDWLTVGLKLLGVYFSVLGVTILSMTVVNLVLHAIEAAISAGSDTLSVSLHPGPMIDLISALQPISYLGCAFVLLRRTDWCLGRIEFIKQETAPNEPGNKSEA